MVDHNLQHLMHLLKNKQVFASYHYINSLSPQTPIPNKSKLINELKVKIDQARHLTADINITLDFGQYPKALKQLKKAQDLVPDFPNIQTDIDFITASISTMEKNIKEAQTLAARGKKQKVNEILKAVQNIDKNHAAIPDVEKKLRRSLRKKNATTFLITTLAIIIPLLYFGFEHITLLQAKDLWSKADTFIGKKQYKQAQALISEMDNRLLYVNIFGQQEKVRLQRIASNMTQSEQFKAGLHGRPFSPAKGSLKKGNERHVEGLLAQASVKENQNIDEALALYDKALQFSEGNIHISEKTLAQISSKRQTTQSTIATQKTKDALVRFNTFLQTGDSFTKNASWQQASTSYLQALKYAKQQHLKNYSEIFKAKRRYNHAVIRENIEDGEVAFNQNRYDDAIMLYRTCMAFIEENQIEDQELTSTIRKRIFTVQQQQVLVLLAELLHQGDQFYLEQEYELSLEKYQTAIALLEKSSQQLFKVDSDVVREQIHQKIAQVETKTIVLSQRNHLLTSYKNILRSNFNLSRNTAFKNPVIVFIANKGDHLIYKVSAFGSKSSASANIKYELDYKFNIKTGRWNINDIPLGA